MDFLIVRGVNYGSLTVLGFDKHFFVTLSLCSYGRENLFYSNFVKDLAVQIGSIFDKEYDRGENNSNLAGFRIKSIYFYF